MFQTTLFLLLLLLGLQALTPALALTYQAGITITGQPASQQFEPRYRDDAESTLQGKLAQDPANTSIRADLGLIQAERFKLDAAEANAKKVLATEPSNTVALLTLGKVAWYRTSSSNMVYRSQRREYLNKALSHFQQAAESDKQRPETYNFLGRVKQELGQYSEARKEYEVALAMDPNYADALVNLASLSLEEKKPTETLRLANKAIQLNSGHDGAHYLKGAALLELGMVNRAVDELGIAIDSLNTALSLNRNSAPIHTVMGKAYEAQGNIAAALTHYRKALQIAPEHTEVVEQLVSLLQRRGDDDQALLELKSAISLQPTQQALLQQAGELALSADKPEQAVDYYRRLLKLAPDNAEASKGLATALLRQAQRDAASDIVDGGNGLWLAEQQLTEALRLTPDNLSLHLALAKVQRASGAVAMPAERIARLVSLPAVNNTQRLQQAEGLMLLGRFDEAQQRINAITQALPSLPAEQQMTLANSLLEMGSLAQAKQVYGTVLANEPNNVLAERGVARVERRQQKAMQSLQAARNLNAWYSAGKRKQAVALYEEALERNPWAASPHVELADVLRKAGSKQAARLHYQAYLTLSPKLPDERRRQIERFMR
ncbi:MAG: tetratricopeptide repeat protein [Vampirovibrionales bacterium]